MLQNYLYPEPEVTKEVFPGSGTYTITPFKTNTPVASIVSLFLFIYFIVSGVFVSLFAPLALSCDLLALRGLRSWRKALMLPWLVLYAILVALVMAVVLTGTLF